MPKYVVERRFNVGSDRMPEIGTRSRRIIEEQFPDIIWHHSHVTVEENGNVRTFCIYEAPDEDAIRRHADALGYHIVGGIFEVAGDVTPEDFPLTDQPA